MSILIRELDATDYDQFVDRLNVQIDQEAVQGFLLSTTMHILH